MKVIDYDQTTFLPLRFIFKNIMLVQKLIDWAKWMKSTTCFFYIEFCTSLWQDEFGVLFRAMVKMDMPKKLLLKEIKAKVYFDGAIIVSFQIK